MRSLISSVLKQQRLAGQRRSGHREDAPDRTVTDALRRGGWSAQDDQQPAPIRVWKRPRDPEER